MQSERIGLQQRWQVSASTLRTASGYPGQTPISDHQPPTRPGDNTPRIMTATGGGNHAGPGWPKPQLSGTKIVTGATAVRVTARHPRADAKRTALPGQDCPH